jgi:hypothetical protein
MAKNHWNTTSKQRQAAYKHGYKSGLELQISEQITEAQYPLRYETETLQYTVPESFHKYTPDFVFTKRDGSLMYIETKGRWTAIDRKKMKYILISNPELDIRMIFQNPNQKISKASRTTYEIYANKLGIEHVAKRDIPAEWLAECLRDGETPTVPKTFFS